MTREIEFSVILPVVHGGNFLKKALVSLRKMDYPSDRFEVLIAGHIYDKESFEIVNIASKKVEFDIRYIGCIDSKRSVELNAAFEVARGCILVFADDDCMFYPDWLQRLHEVMEHDPNAGIIGGSDELIENQSAFNQALDYVLNSPYGTGAMRGSKSPGIGKYYPKLWNMAIRYETASKVTFKTNRGLSKLFNESLIVYEDVELAKRIQESGGKTSYVPELSIKHYRDTNITSFIKRNFNMARTCRSLGIHRLPHILGLISLVILIVLLTSSFFFQCIRIAFLIYLVLYIILLTVSAAIGFIMKRRLSLLIIVPLLLISLHLSRVLGYLFPWHYKSMSEERL